MDLRQLFTDDEAVSPVIGVILMVAITVILAAVIGAFVLDIGGSQEAAPQVQWEWADDASASPSEVTLEHGSGDTVNNPNQISLEGDNLIGTYDGAALGSSELFDSDTITASSSASIPQDGTNGIDGSENTGTLTLVWESSSGGQSTELSSHDYDLN